MLQFLGLQKVGHNLATEQQTTAHINIYYMLHIMCIYIYIYFFFFSRSHSLQFQVWRWSFQKFCKKKKIHVHIAMTWPESFCFSQYTSEGIFYSLLSVSFIIHEKKVKMKVAWSCPTLCNPMDYTVHGILQARILEWVTFSFSRGSSQPRDRTQVSHIAGRFFTSWATWEAQEYWSG